MGLLNKFRKKEKRLAYEEEVTSSLSSILNTKGGYGSWIRGFGLGTYLNNKVHEHVVGEVIKDVRFNIESFEKRVKIVDIEILEDGGKCNLSLKLKCQLGGTFHFFYLGFKEFEDVVKVEVES